MLEARTAPSRATLVAVPAIAVALTLLCGFLLFTAIGSPPEKVAYAFFVQPFASVGAIGEVLLKTGPLLLVAQGLAIGYRADIWNIGAEGQLIVGAICASVLAIAFETSTSPFLLPAMILAGAAGGAAWAGIAALLRVRFGASEILTTFMLSSVALQLLYFLVTGPLKDPMGFNFPQSVMFGDAALFAPLIPGTRANTSLLMGLAATLVAWVFMARTTAGFRLMVGGLAPAAARYAGFSQTRAIWIGLLAGGACAGLAGVGEVAGPLGMLQRTLSPGYGFAAIIVAFLGGLNPIGIVFAALVMAVIYVGGDYAVVSAGVPNASATILQGFLLVFYLAASLLFTHRIRWRKAAVAEGSAP
ncbi:ABC transporter permease [Chthonobacter albigriseus]|uniref:ABC transporter permease n=1 Tax=Chthonobacter albigriseus TaxID=1683161 RepID=UPI0015EEB0A2|nr:ABC transporter permease [Chthonobacter albigriseus]